MVTPWKYGDAGDRIPVERGQVWGAGPHRVACADLEAGGVELARSLGAPALLLSDPPWNGGNATAFRSKAGVPRRVSFPALMARVLSCAGPSVHECWIEMGPSGERDFLAVAADAGWLPVQRFAVTYYKKHPCAMFLLTRDGKATGRMPELVGRDEFDVMDDILLARTQPGEAILDPCLGRGLMLRAALRTGRVCYGTELHPRRLAAAIDSAQKLSTLTFTPCVHILPES